MTAAEPAQIATLIVTGGAVAFGVGAALWAWRMTAGTRDALAGWRGRVAALEDKAARADSLFNAHPGLVLVWETPPEPGHAEWSSPKVYGSPGALTSMLRFADLAEGAMGKAHPAAAILDSIADYQARPAGGEATTLRRAMTALAERGEPFSLSIAAPSGRRVEADGRAAGVQLVVWLTDSAAREGARAGDDGAAPEADGDPRGIMEMLGGAPRPAWRMSSGGRLQWVNAAYASAVDAADPADAVARQLMLEPGLAAMAGEALQAGAPAVAVRPAVIGGARRALEIAIHPIPGGTAGMAADVTEGEEARVALRRFRQAHDETLNHLAEAVAIFDRTRRLVFHNSAFTALFGLDEAALNGRPGHGALLDMLREARMLPAEADGDYPGWKAAEMAHYEAGPDAETADELWTLGDGRTLRLARQRHPLGGVLLIFQDMTDQLSLQARYNTLIKVQRATLDRLHEAVAVFGSDGRLRLRNAAFETLWRIDPEMEEDAPFEAVADACHALHPDAGAWNALKARITDPSPESRQPVTGEIRRADGSILTFLTRPLPDGATLIAWDDITDTRRVEEALRERADALEASERIKTQFVEHVSYQLRTPLTTIGGYADLLAQGYAGELGDRQKAPVDAIVSASGQLAKLIDDILDIAAIDAGQLELDLGDVRLDAAGEEAVELVAARAERSGVKLAVEAKGVTSPIRADEARIKQVLYNLLSNALDHVGSGGRIEYGAETEAGEARFWVADDGAGIAPDRQARVFERFERGSDGGGGAGLGLALVREIIVLHGGWVELESEPGRGTKVTCHLPEDAGRAHAAPELAFSAGGDRAAG
ncbi:PAS domain-containing protein [Glycocaulis profundi]|nr:PAS domain-containing protein [Glycocaulis profundi]